MNKQSSAYQPKGKVLSFLPTGEYYYSRGMKAYRHQQLPKAKKYFERAFELEPQEPLILCQLAMVYTELGEYKDSNRLLSSILDELDPTMRECHYLLANNYAYLGLFREAYREAQNYLSYEPDGDFSDDAEDLLDLLSLELEMQHDPIEVDEKWVLKQEEARDYLENGQFQEAKDLLEEVIAEKDDFWAAYNNLALAHFYEGDLDEAKAVLVDVLDKNEGNLHALCNLMIFFHYEERDGEVETLAMRLQKIRPISIDHRFKLGATFTLTGYYEPAYTWLHSLKKLGFEGDATFYYWYTKAAYHTGHDKAAKEAWAHVLKEHPEREGMEPWAPKDRGLENQLQAILNLMQTDDEEQHVLALFMCSRTQQGERWLASEKWTQQYLSEPFELVYWKYVTGKPIEDPLEETAVLYTHRVADSLYRHYHPMTWDSLGMYLMWFTVSSLYRETPSRLRNDRAWVAALMYMWKTVKRETITQQEVATMHQVSVSTVRKYVKWLKDILL